MRELLEIGDPLLPVVRRRASRHREAHAWLLDSAKHWSVAEFLRRERQRAEMVSDPKAGIARYKCEELENNGIVRWTDHILDKQMHALARHQCAVLTATASSLATDSGDMVLAGFLGQDCRSDYVQMWRPTGGPVAGMMTVLDVIELPPEFRLRAWPWPLGTA